MSDSGRSSSSTSSSPSRALPLTAAAFDPVHHPAPPLPPSVPALVLHKLCAGALAHAGFDAASVEVLDEFEGIVAECASSPPSLHPREARADPLAQSLGRSSSMHTPSQSSAGVTYRARQTSSPRAPSWASADRATSCASCNAQRSLKVCPSVCALSREMRRWLTLASTARPAPDRFLADHLRPPTRPDSARSAPHLRRRRRRWDPPPRRRGPREPTADPSAEPAPAAPPRGRRRRRRRGRRVRRGAAPLGRWRWRWLGAAPERQQRQERRRGAARRRARGQGRRAGARAGGAAG